MSMRPIGSTHTGQPGPCTMLTLRRQQVLDAVAGDRVRVAAAELHQVIAAVRPRFRARCGGRCGAPARRRGIRRRTSCGLFASSSRPASANSASVRSASAGSSFVQRVADMHDHVVANPHVARARARSACARRRDRSRLRRSGSSSTIRAGRARHMRSSHQFSGTRQHLAGDPGLPERESAVVRRHLAGPSTSSRARPEPSPQAGREDAVDEAAAAEDDGVESAVRGRARCTTRPVPRSASRGRAPRRARDRLRPRDAEPAAKGRARRRRSR